MGLKAIKKGYWDSGNLQIEAYYRRRNLEERWIWIAGKVSSVMEKPIAGLVMNERCCDKIQQTHQDCLHCGQCHRQVIFVESAEK